MKTNEILAYLAAMLDGEGSICLTRIGAMSGRPQGHRPTIGIDNSHRYPAWLAKRVFGGRIQRCALPSGKTLYRWCASGKRAVDTLNTLLPYLRVKRRQARLVVTCPTRARGQRQTRMTPEELAEREELAAKVRTLNKGKKAFNGKAHYRFPEVNIVQ